MTVRTRSALCGQIGHPDISAFHPISGLQAATTLGELFGANFEIRTSCSTVLKRAMHVGDIHYCQTKNDNSTSLDSRSIAIFKQL